MKHKEMHFS